VSSVDERQRLHAKYKRQVKERGKPFYPYAMFHDTVMSLVVVVVIVVLSVVWYYSADDTEPGALGPYYSEKADPGTTSFVPRPDWYFYFLFYLLRIFKWPATVVIGTVGIPTILLIVLLAIPFLDRTTERRLSRRPVIIVTTILVALSMGILTYKGATASEFVASEVVGLPEEWAQEQGFAGNELAVQGARLFAEAGCLTCHTYLGTGSSNLGAPDLSEEGTKGRGLQWQIDHLKCPSCTTPGSPMPPYAELGDQDLRALATFLEASKGSK